jgi:hypothetical protein
LLAIRVQRKPAPTTPDRFISIQLSTLPMAERLPAPIASDARRRSR